MSQNSNMSYVGRIYAGMRTAKSWPLDLGLLGNWRHALGGTGGTRAGTRSTRAISSREQGSGQPRGLSQAVAVYDPPYHGTSRTPCNHPSVWLLGSLGGPTRKANTGQFKRPSGTQQAL